MTIATLQSGFSDPQHQSAAAFRHIMRVMAQPGMVETVAPVDAPSPLSVAAGVALLTLCDAETPVYLAPSLDVPAVREWITFHTNAPFVGPSGAMFALGRWEELSLREFPVGTSEYPDRSATIIVETDTLSDQGAVLSGPGIRTTSTLSLPEGFAARNEGVAYPLGLDFFMTSGDRLAAIPRTTRVG